jgi:hypothetical protein
MSEIELAWLAGLLEGEGTFGTVRRATGQVAPIVKVKMTDLDVIQRAQGIMGIRRYTIEKVSQPQYKPQYLIRLTGKRAAALMLVLLPHMGERRAAKIREIISVVEYQHER